MNIGLLTPHAEIEKKHVLMKLTTRVAVCAPFGIQKRMFKYAIFYLFSLTH